MLRHFPLLLISASLAFSQSSSLRVQKAVFSDRQLFWPALEGKGRPALKPSKPAKAAGAGAKSKAAKSGGESVPRIAVLPIELKDYRESLPCDSCHRLSANGMEFFLENYLKDRMTARFPKYDVELIAPSQPLLETKLNLLAYLDSLDFPWERWFPDSAEEIVYRPHDRFTSEGVRKRMDKLGGMLGASHLLLPCKMRVSATPKSSITHEGGLDWEFRLVFWNVAAGGPEWALRFSDRETGMNLDDALDGRLDKALGAAWDGLPGELSALWNAEPR
jgi:hypothetical protein